MFNIIRSNLSLYLENSPMPVSVSYFSDTTKKIAVIVGIVLAAFSALTALFYAYRNYNSHDKPTLPPVHPSPKPGLKPFPNPALNPNTNHIPDPNLFKTTSPATTNQPDHKYNVTPSPVNSIEIDDEAIARKFQEEEDAKLAQQFNIDDANTDYKKPPKPGVGPKPLISVNPISPDPIESPKAPTYHLTTTPPHLAAPSPFKEIEDICSLIGEKAFTDPHFSAVKALAKVHPATKKQVESLLNEIVAEFERRNPLLPQKIAYGAQVPAYFANVDTEGMIIRHYLSLLGIRNLVKWGANIIDDFRDTKFLGGEHHYTTGKGLNAFKYATGTTVDLDTEIDATTDEQAVKLAEPMIIKFGEFCGLKKFGGGKLTTAEVASLLSNRKLQLPVPPYYSVHQSASNTDRNNHGVWKYVTPGGKTQYFVNVPNADLVILATLRLPYMVAELAYRTKLQNHGTLSKEFFDDFFKKGLSDMCFNDKAKTFIAFYHIWSAKLDGVVTDPVEDARKKIAQGFFGEAVRVKGAAAITSALTRTSLINLLDTHDFNCNWRSLEQWLKDEEKKITTVLKNQGLWEASLYREDCTVDPKNPLAKSDYFLLNEATLKPFLKHYYEHLKNCDI